MDETRTFALGDILSITTPWLVSRRGMEGVYDILNYMTGDQLWTHQLPRASRECAPHLLRQHPQLADADAATVTPETWEAWLREQEAKYGAELPVARIPRDDHARKDPVAELQEMLPGTPILVVNLPPQEGA